MKPLNWPKVILAAMYDCRFIDVKAHHLIGSGPNAERCRDIVRRTGKQHYTFERSICIRVSP